VLVTAQNGANLERERERERERGRARDRKRGSMMSNEKNNAIADACRL